MKFLELIIIRNHQFSKKNFKKFIPNKMTFLNNKFQKNKNSTFKTKIKKM